MGRAAVRVRRRGQFEKSWGEKGKARERKENSVPTRETRNEKKQEKQAFQSICTNTYVWYDYCDFEYSCMYIYIYTSTYIHIHMHIYRYKHMCENMYICVYIYA